MGLLSALRNLVTRSDDQVVDEYVAAGCAFANAAFELKEFGNRLPNFDRLLNDWERTEADYAKLGFRTIALSQFEEHNDLSLKHCELLRVQRGPAEQPIFHAVEYREKNP